MAFDDVCCELLVEDFTLLVKSHSPRREKQNKIKQASGLYNFKVKVSLIRKKGHRRLPQPPHHFL